MTTLLVIAKEPVPGRVKTRLTPPLHPEEAARLAEAALTDTLRTVLAAPATRRVLVLDGRPGEWLPDGIEVVPQSGGRPRRAAGRRVRACARARPCSIGMDTPQVTPCLLAPGAGPRGWREDTAWFGPAADGGLLGAGSRRPGPGAAAWRADVCSRHRQRCNANG